MDAFIVVVIALWAMLSVLAQIAGGSLVARIKAHDIGAFIPAWTFFAPNPGTSDYGLVYRDLTGDRWSAWHPVSAGRPDTKARFIWNPEKRLTKLESDLISSLMRKQRSHDELSDDNSRWLLSVPYLLLLSLVETAPHELNSGSTQFAVVSLDRFHTNEKSFEVVFLSPTVGIENLIEARFS